MNFLKNLLGIPTLKSKISQNQSQITSLQSQISHLQTQLKTQSTKSSASIKSNSTKIQNIKSLITKPDETIALKNKIIKLLKSPHSTNQLAKQLNISRPYTSRILNQLQKENKIHQHSKIKRTIFYIS